MTGGTTAPSGGGRPTARIRRRRPRAAARFISRDLRLAAWFLWMTPLAAALSIRLMASRSASSLSSAPCSMAAMARLVRVRSSDRTALLRACRLMVWRLRLIWLLMFATDGPCRPGAVGSVGRAGCHATVSGDPTRAGRRAPVPEATEDSSPTARLPPAHRPAPAPAPAPGRCDGRTIRGPLGYAGHPRAPRRPYPQLLHHQPRRPRQVHPVRPDPGADRGRRPPP